MQVFDELGIFIQFIYARHGFRVLKDTLFIPIEKIKSFFDKKSSKDIVDEYASSRYYHKIDIKDLLRIDCNNAKYRRCV